MGIDRDNSGGMDVLKVSGPHISTVNETKVWVEQFLRTAEYNELLSKNLIDGEGLMLLAESKTDLEAFGFNWCHRLKLFNYFRKFHSSGHAQTVAPSSMHDHTDISQGAPTPTNSATELPKVQGAKKIPTYEDIFINKSHGKNELAENWPRAHAALLEGHQKIRCLFNNPDPQFAPLMHDILHSNFRTKPEMRAKLSEFVDKHIDKLLVLEFNDDEVGQTVMIKWKPLELYKQMLSFRYDYRKGKHSRTSSNSAKLLQEKHKKGQQTMEDVEEKLDGKANSPVAVDQNISNKSQRSSLGDEHDGVSCKSQKSFLGDEHDEVSCNVLNTNDTGTNVDNSDEEFYSLLSKPRLIDSTPSKGHKASHFTDEVDDMSPAHFLRLRKTVQLQQSKRQQQEPETNSSPLSPTPIRNRVQRDVDKFGNNLDDPKASSPHKADTSTPMTHASKRKLVDSKVQTRTVDIDEGHNQQEVILDEIKVTVTELTLEARRVIVLMVLSCESVSGIAARINQYMAGENSKSFNKPFKNYLRKSIADKIDFVVSHALQTKQVKLKGKAQLREGKIYLNRLNVIVT